MSFGAVAVGAAWLTLAFAAAWVRAQATLRAGPSDPFASLVELAWVAREGAISSVFARAHVGPLPQLLTAPIAWAAARPMHIAFASLILSAALTAALTWPLASALAKRAGARLAIGLVVFFFAFHHAADAPAAIALLLATQRVGERGGARTTWTLLGCLALAWTWTPLSVLPSLALLAGGAVGDALASRRARGAFRRHVAPLRAALTLLVAWAALGVILGPGDALPHSMWLAALERADPPSVGAVTLAAVGVLTAGATAIRARDAQAGARVGALVALGAVTLLGWRLAEAASLLWPVAIGLTIEGVRWRGARPAAGWTLLGWGAIVGLLWIPLTHGAWTPSAWASALRGAPDADPGLRSEREIVLAWMEGTRAEHPEACVVWPAGDPLGRVRARARGPVDPLRAARGGAARAAAIEAAACPFALVRRAGPGAPVGEDDVLLASMYAPLAELSPNLVVYGLRSDPVEVAARPVALRRWVSDPVPASGRVDIALRDPIRADELIALELELEGGLLFAPSMTLTPLRDGEPAAPPTQLPPLAARRPEVVFARAGDLATSAWSRGLDSTEGAEAIDGLRVELADAGLFERFVTVHDLRALRSPVRPLAARGPCAHGDAGPEPDAAHAAVLDDTRARRDGDAVRLIPERGAPAESYAAVRPCDEACLHAEVGLVGDAPTRVSLHIVGASGPRVALDATLGVGWPRPVVVPLRERDRWLVWRAEGEGEVRVQAPRIEPCGALVELVHTLHQGQRVELPPEASVSGDELVLQLAPAGAAPPRVEIELPTRLSREPCLSVDLSARDVAGPVGMLLGIRRGRELFWLARHIVAAEDAALAARDVPLGRFAGQPVQLVFSAWPMDPGVAGRAVFARPRVVECGAPEPPWPF